MEVRNWQIITSIICLILGTVLHFTYQWSGENKIISLFSAVNESTWEHLKLVYFPMIIMAIIGYFVIGKTSQNYWTAQAIGIFTAMLFITIFFYTYTGIIGMNYAILNIGSFIVGVLLGEYVIYKFLISPIIYNTKTITIIVLILLLIMFLIYTFNPPRIALFKDPITGEYGI